MVERSDGSALPYVDVLACGNGQWGGLGNAVYSNAQGTPLRAKNVSGLLECKSGCNMWCDVCDCEQITDVILVSTQQIVSKLGTCSPSTRTTCRSRQRDMCC